MAQELAVEVLFAGAGGAVTVKVRLPPGATVRDAIARSGLTERCPDFTLHQAGVGVFGAARALDAPVEDGDRVEIYRPLAADPKDARRLRTRAARKK
ncbi:MAG TPA: RnfH family protein [Candidatus Binatia bacterium]|nr:RnfH family protein [Candidatus Binatia bacterium]